MRRDTCRLVTLPNVVILMYETASYQQARAHEEGTLSTLLLCMKWPPDPLKYEKSDDLNSPRFSILFGSFCPFLQKKNAGQQREMLSYSPSHLLLLSPAPLRLEEDRE